MIKIKIKYKKSKKLNHKSKIEGVVTKAREILWEIVTFQL